MLKQLLYNLIFIVLLLFCSWGFHAHRTINKNAVYTLPPNLSEFFIKYINVIEEDATLADKRRYIDSTEACKHYIDIDLYGVSPFDSVPRGWHSAKQKFSLDTLKNRGLLPWTIYWEYQKLIGAMDSGNAQTILNTAADLGHYIADACVPLHTTYNYNGQFSNQKGIHALWESRIPELYSKNYNYYTGKAVYLDDPLAIAWDLIEESFNLVDSTFTIEIQASNNFITDEKYTFKTKNSRIVNEYSYEFIDHYNSSLNNMVERRLQRAIVMVGSFWYTAWVNAGQPNLMNLKRPKNLKIKQQNIYHPKRLHE